jgi:hypothetical protein
MTDKQTIYVVETSNYPFYAIRKAYTTHKSALKFGNEWVSKLSEVGSFIIHVLELEE